MNLKSYLATTSILRDSTYQAISPVVRSNPLDMRRATRAEMVKTLVQSGLSEQQAEFSADMMLNEKLKGNEMKSKKAKKWKSKI